MASTRPRRSVPKRDYKKMTTVVVPRAKCARLTSRSTKQDAQPSSKSSNSEPPNQLYRLNILEEDPSGEMVKVRYVGYGSEFDEWRPMGDIVDLTEENDTDDQTEDLFDVRGVLGLPARKKFCLYEELAYRIKSLLVSNRKGDPVCCVTMNFDSVYFDCLVSRCTLIKSSKQKCYTLAALSNLTDLLGPRWYIRGINEAGDFCYVQPETVKLQLRSCRGKCDYQLLDSGRLEKCLFGKTDQLVFRFVRGDGTLAQWYSILKSCQ